MNIATNRPRAVFGRAVEHQEAERIEVIIVAFSL
jgi:hypothetical protein